jgi:hypothetical protein
MPDLCIASVSNSGWDRCLRGTRGSADRMRRRGSGIGALLLILWLVIGVIAAVQRGYFNSADTSCASAATIAVTVVAGPLNYVGVNPRVDCQLPQPSQ